MPDARSPDTFGTAPVIRPGHRFGPKPTGLQIARTPCSEVTAFCVCPQYHAFGYEMGLKAADEAPARAVGTLVHVGLAYRYGALMAQRPEWMVYPDPRTALWTIAQGNYEAATVALKVFDAYQVHYPVEQNYWRPIGVEHQLEVVFEIDGIPVRYTLRLDLIAQDLRDGALVYVDHKTTFKITKWIGHNYATDREMLTALALLRNAGYDIKRVVINAMTKGTRENPQPEFERYDVPISADAYNRLGADTYYWIRQMRNIKTTHPDPLNRPRAYEQCMRKFGQCLVPGTLVRTRRGWMEIESVTTNDDVVGHDGQFHRVAATTHREYDGDVITTIPWRNGIGVTTTPDHRVLSDSGTWIEASALATSDRVHTVFAPSDWAGSVDLLPLARTKKVASWRHKEWVPANIIEAVKAEIGLMSHRKVAGLFGLNPGVVRRLWGKPQHKPVSPEPTLADGKIWLRDGHKPIPRTLAITKEFAELAGLYIAEGCAGQKITFSFGRHEVDLVRRCRELIQSVLGEPSTTNDAGSVTNVIVSHGLWAHVFKTWFGGECHEKRMPTWLETAPFDIFVHALHGWVEGDGGDRKELAYGITASPVLALQMWSALSRENLVVSLTKMSDRSGGVIDGRRIVQKHTSYAIQIRAIALRQLAPTLKLRTPAERNHIFVRSPVFKPGRMLSLIRKKVVRRYKGLVYDLSVPTSGSFLANGIVVHNCDFAPVCTHGPQRLAEFTKKW